LYENSGYAVNRKDSPVALWNRHPGIPRSRSVSRMSAARTKIEALERHWQIALPEAFHRLYGAFTHPFISPCEFLSLDALLDDSERWCGMLPQFLPFGHDGAEDYYGFYVCENTSATDFPVLYWDHEYDHYCPIASGFGAFLRWCVIHGRYLAQDSFEEDDPQYNEEEIQRQEFAEVVGLPKGIVLDPLPRNDRELYERLAAADPQAAQAMAQLGSLSFGRGDFERARDFFARACESTPWFSDPYYLIAETYRIKENLVEAVPRWWQVLQSPIALSTRTPNYDLGEDHLEAEIYEAAIDQLIRHRDAVPADIMQSPLGMLIFEGDAFEPGERLLLSEELEVAGDTFGEERELLNALSLATDDTDTDASYERLIRVYNRMNRQREAAICRHDRII
jgi:hypothetical protein